MTPGRYGTHLVLVQFGDWCVVEVCDSAAEAEESLARRRSRSAWRHEAVPGFMTVDEVRPDVHYHHYDVAALPGGEEGHP